MQRRALFVGIDHYEDHNIRDLEFAEEDAIELSSLFRYQLGFDRVERLRGDAVSLNRVIDAVETLVNGLGPGDQFVFFFAGHGIQPPGADHKLLCRGAKKLLIEEGESHDALSIGLLERLTEVPGVNRLLILDACRSNPYGQRDAFGEGFQWEETLRDIVAGKKTAYPQSGRGGFHILYSCRRHQYAQELPGLGRGLFSGALVALLETAARDGGPLQLDDGFHERLSRGMEKLARHHGVAVGQEPARATVGAPIVLLPRIARRPRTSPGILDVQGWPAEKAAAYQRAWADYLGEPTVTRHPMAAGGEGPEMLLIPPGRYLMGSPDEEPERQESEGPRHWVRIERPWRMARYALSTAEFARFVGQTGYRTEAERSGFSLVYEPKTDKWEKGEGVSWRNGVTGLEPAAENHPVLHVSWNDAKAYAGWLAEQTGKAYHLPTEARWEYAARAGNAGPFGLAGQISTATANYDGRFSYEGSPQGEYRRNTVAVDAFAPNPW